MRPQSPGRRDMMRRDRPHIASLADLRGHLREDYVANRGGRQKWTFWSGGFQAVASYRIAVWVADLRPRVLRPLLRLLLGPHRFVVRNFYGIELYPTARIGRRFRIVHQGGIVIHAGAVIGDDCTIRQGVTIGAAAGGGAGRLPPQLGSRVSIGAGAVVAGTITIGDDVTIGPNAVVMQNVPAGSIVVTPPPRIMAPPPRRAPTPLPDTAASPSAALPTGPAGEA